MFSKAMFTTYKTSEVMTMDGNIYLLQYGSYISRNVMEENVKKLDNYITLEEDNKYYVYIGAFTNLEYAKKMQKILENKNIYTYLKNDYIGDSKIIDSIKEIEEEYENNHQELSEINKKILAIIKKM